MNNATTAPTYCIDRVLALKGQGSLISLTPKGSVFLSALQGDISAILEAEKYAKVMSKDAQALVNSVSLSRDGVFDLYDAPYGVDRFLTVLGEVDLVLECEFDTSRTHQPGESYHKVRSLVGGILRFGEDE